MSGHEEPGFIDRLFRACLVLLGVAFALYFAVQLIICILPWLILIAGVAAAVWVVIVVIKTWRDRL